MLDFLRTLFTYDAWAVSRSLSSLENSENSKLRILLSHVLISQKVWLMRLRGADSSHVRIFEQLSLAECAEMSNELCNEYANFLNSLSEADLDSVINYRNTEGIEYQTKVKDILTHVGLHGVYHRGQIALLVRENDGEAINTDFMTFIRL